MVYRVYVEKKPGFAPEAAGALADFRSFLGLKNLRNVRVLNRYDVEGIDPDLFEQAKRTIFSEPQLDIVTSDMETEGACAVFGVEALPGQFDQRADSAAQCIQLLSQQDRPLVSFARIYVLYGDLSAEEIDMIRHHVINPVETREASLELPETLRMEYAAPDHVATAEGFTQLDDEGLKELLGSMGLAMDLDDLKFLQAYFRDEENRDPTVTEIRVVDTYWSDHCRHTTFGTQIDRVEIEDE
ncbi:MAG: phosphoribosylformylglycinamidine synthase, partial [Solobacterium sp.]|nr:phosphoribosylformylglycinamidine synthase [Solobacterium sp.]